MKLSLESSTLRTVRYFFRAYPKRTWTMVGLLILSGLAEGVGLLSLLPLLEFAIGQETGDPSALTQTTVRAFHVIGMEPGLLTLLGLIVVAITLKALFLWMASKHVGYTVAQMATDLRLRLIRALLRARWRYFARRPTGFFANAISSEAARASGAYRMTTMVLAGVIQIVVYLVAVILVSWEVAVIALVVAPLVLLAFKGFVQMSRQAGAEQTNVMKNLIARITELLPGIKAVKAMARERHLLPFLEEETKLFNRAQQSTVLAEESLRAFREPVIVVVLAIGLYGAVSWGDASASSVLVGAVLFYRVMTTSGNLQGNYQAVTVNESAFRSLMDTIEEAEEAEEPNPQREPAPDLEREIRLESVSFAYDGELVLDSVTLGIAANSLVTLTGPSGAGKTTLVDLVTGLLEADSGTIYVDDVPIGEFDVTDWRRKIGYVPQDMVLFHDTVYRNVTLGESQFTRDDVERALRAAAAWDFVSTLPEGMDHVVGERGSQISGGQRQRIAIARALLAQPRLLILDEATTALDPDTEKRICENLRNLSERMTIIAISHQKAITRVSDRVFDVQGKQVTEIPALRAISRNPAVG